MIAIGIGIEINYYSVYTAIYLFIFFLVYLDLNYNLRASVRMCGRNGISHP